MTHYVEAIEFDGDDLPARVGGSRRPVCAHAYDVDSGDLAHRGHQTRVGFAEPLRGWNTSSTLRRCGACGEVVTRLMITLTGELAAQTRAAQPHQRGPRPSAGPLTHDSSEK